jgi:hypothetical protein
MSLPLSPNQITLGQVGNFFSYTANPRFISQLYRGGTYVASGATSTTGIPTSGTIRLSNFHGGQLLIKASPAWIAKIISTTGSTFNTRSFLLTSTMVDENGDGLGADGIVLAGYYEGGTQVYTGADSLVKTYGEIGNTTAFLLRYNVDGTLNWGARIGGNVSGGVYEQVLTSIHHSYGDNRLAICGYFRAFNTNGLTFYNANDTAFGTTLPATSTFTPEGFVGMYNQSGTVQWVARIGGANSEYPSSVYSPNGAGVMVTGISDSTVQVYNSNGTLFGTSLVNLGSWDPFLIKYNSSGTVQWVARMGGSGPDGDAYSNFRYTGTGLGGRFTDITTMVFTVGSNPTTIYNSNGSVKFTLSTFSSGTYLVGYNGGGFSGTAGAALYVGYMTHRVKRVVSAGTPSDSIAVQVCIGTYSGTFTAYSATSTGVGSAFGTNLTSTGTAVFLAMYYSVGTVPTAASVTAVAQIQSTTSIDIINAYANPNYSQFIVITGTFSGTLTAFNSNGVAFGTSLTSNGTDSYIVCYSTTDDINSFTVEWVARIDGPVNTITTDSVSFDLGGGNIKGVVVAGRIQSGGTVEAYNSVNQMILSKSITSGSSVDSHTFVIRYSIDTINHEALKQTTLSFTASTTMTYNGFTYFTLPVGITEFTVTFSGSTPLFVRYPGGYDQELYSSPYTITASEVTGQGGNAYGQYRLSVFTFFTGNYSYTASVTYKNT